MELYRQPVKTISGLYNEFTVYDWSSHPMIV
jgi:hypothetical protein